MLLFTHSIRRTFTTYIVMNEKGPSSIFNIFNIITTQELKNIDSNSSQQLNVSSLLTRIIDILIVEVVVIFTSKILLVLTNNKGQSSRRLGYRYTINISPNPNTSLPKRQNFNLIQTF